MPAESVESSVVLDPELEQDQTDRPVGLAFGAHSVVGHRAKTICGPVAAA